ncbi:MAG: glycosyltransferase family 39 protein [Planctomycetes bacterium]|nr:glycosyltransferase family 39 protein [Planctomycetota bacterium]
MTVRHPLIWVTLLMLLAFAVLTPPPDHVIDTQLRLRVTRAMLETGTLEIDNDPAFSHLTPQSPNGRHYCVYPIGQSLVLLPLDSTAKTLSYVIPVGAIEQRTLRDCLTAWMYFWTINGLLALAVYGVLRRLRLSRRSAALGTLAVFFTSLWLIWSRSMQEETLAALLLVSALYFGLRGAQSGGVGRSGLVIGALFGLLANVRYNGAFAALGVMVWVLAACPDMKSRVRLVVAAAAVLIPALGLAGWYNTLRFGSAAETGYQAYGASIGRSWAFNLADFGALTGGSDFGLLWFALPLLLLPFAFAGKRRTLVIGVCALGVTLLLHVIFLSGFFMHEPGGHFGYCGPRYLAHGAILLAIPGWVGARAAMRMGRRLPLAPRLAAIALAAGALFQLAGVPLQAEIERYQDAMANYAETPPPRPAAYVPRRFKNLLIAATGKIREETVPEKIREPGKLDDLTAERIANACTPNLLPWRLPLQGRPHAVLPAWLIAAVSALWWAALAGLVGMMLVGLRRLTSRSPMRPATGQNPPADKTGQTA